MANGEPTSGAEEKHSKVSNSIASEETRRTTGSSKGRTIVRMGYAPFTVMAMLKTVPPQSRQNGGVSDHPPPKSIRAGADTVRHDGDTELSRNDGSGREATAFCTAE